jgi:type III secretion system low calcium response chaperone LcrH/SycD
MEESKDIFTKEELHQHIKSAVNKLGPNFTKEQKIEYAKILVKIFEKGMQPKEALNITDNEMAQIYSFAFHEFSAGKFAEARELFKMLYTLEPSNADFAIALGICHHRLKDFDYALQLYMVATLLDPETPVPLFYAYDCFMQTGNEMGAGMMLCNVIKKASADPKYARIKMDAQLRLELLESKINQELAAKKEKSS